MIELLIDWTLAIDMSLLSSLSVMVIVELFSSISLASLSSFLRSMSSLLKTYNRSLRRPILNLPFWKDVYYTYCSFFFNRLLIMVTNTTNTTIFMSYINIHNIIVAIKPQ